MPKYITVVYKEHTLGVLHGKYLDVLNGLGSRGGVSIMNSPVYVNADEYRPATLADFDTFKVSYHTDYIVVD